MKKFTVVILFCFVAIAMMSFYSAATAASRKKQIIYMVVFWVSFALAMLAKGPAPLPLVLLPLFVYFVIYKEWKKIPKLLPVVGSVIFLALVLAWPAALFVKLSQQAAESGTGDVMGFWKTEFVDRFLRYSSE